MVDPMALDHTPMLMGIPEHDMSWQALIVPGARSANHTLTQHRNDGQTHDDGERAEDGLSKVKLIPLSKYGRAEKVGVPIVTAPRTGGRAGGMCSHDVDDTDEANDQHRLSAPESATRRRHHWGLTLSAAILISLPETETVL